MIRKRGNLWASDFTIWREGKRVRIRQSLHTESRIVALDKAHELKARLEEELRIASPRWEDFCRRYMEYAWSEKPRSALREGQRLEKIKDFFSGLEIEFLTDVTPYHIDLLKKKLRSRRLAPSTIRHYLQILRGMFYLAIKWGIYTGVNPLKQVRFPKPKPVRTIQALTAAQERRVVQASRQISESPQSELQAAWGDLVEFTLNTGLRKAEVLELRWSSINGDTIEVTGKGDRARIVPLNERAQKIIARQPERDPYVFDIPNRNQHDLMRRTVAQVRERSGVGFFTFHILRHTHATRLIERGVDLVTVSAILGHSKLTTSLIYAHTDQKKMRDAVAKLDIG